MAQVEVISEREVAAGWRFEVQALAADGVLSRRELTLAWADYNLWSADGGDAPASVAEAVMLFLLSRDDAAALPARFDASLARRRFDDADRAIPALIHR